MDKIPFDPYDFFGYIASGLLIVVGMEQVLGFPRVMGQDLKPVDVALLVLAVYVAGQLIAAPAKALLENLAVARGLGRPSEILFRERKPLLRSRIFPGYFEPLPDPMRTRVLERARQEGVATTGEPLFVHVRYSPCILDNERSLQKLDAFVNKYGFNRNLSFASLLVGAAMLLAGTEPRGYGITGLVAGVLLFYRYLKFFRQYSYEMFNVFGGRSGASASAQPPPAP